jgi:hypothetical protein
MHTRHKLSVLGLVLAFVALLAAPAQAAAWLTSPADQQENATLQYSSEAKLKHRGTEVTWDIRFSCPAGQAYSINAIVIDRGAPGAYPEWLSNGGDSGPTAVLTSPVTGTCKGLGKTQTVKLSLFPTLRNGIECDENFENCVERSGVLPLAVTPPTDGFTLRSGAFVVVQGDGFRASACMAPSCAESTSPYIRLTGNGSPNPLASVQ